MAILEINNLHVYLKTRSGFIRAVNGIDLCIQKRECYALVGESGCGKSMMANAITRLLPENAVFVEGSDIRFEGQSLVHLSERQMRMIRGNQIGMVFQEPMTALNSVMTIGSQLKEALTVYSEGEIGKGKVIELLSKVKISNPEYRINSFPHELSGGMKQRVVIAMALARRPKLLIADEPTTALDVTVQAEIIHLLKSLQLEYGLSILFISHDLSLVKHVADRVGVMYSGQLVEEADKDIFFNHPRHPYSQMLLDAKFLNLDINREHKYKLSSANLGNLDVDNGCSFRERCKFYKQPECDQSQDLDQNHVRCWQWNKLDKNSTESNHRSSSKESGIQNEQKILEVESLNVRFPLKRNFFWEKRLFIEPLKNISFSVFKGETLALVGESGSGKSTLAKVILQLVAKNKGTVKFKGKCTSKWALEGEQFKREVQMIFQDPYASMNPKLSVKEILSEGLLAQNMLSSESDLQNRLVNLLSSVGLTEKDLGKYPHEFSGGQRQRLAIARSLSVQPELVICDEPTSALDVSVQARVLRLLNQLKKDFGLTYLFITHDLSVVQSFADRLIVMDQGEIVEEGEVNDVLNSPKHPYTQSLLNASFHKNHA